MGADLFESFVGTIIAAVTLGRSLKEDASAAMAIPFYLSAAGAACSIFGAAMVGTNETQVDPERTMNTLLWAIRKGIFIASGLNLVAAALIMTLLGLPGMIFPFATGLISGVCIGLATEYFTAFEYQPVRLISAAGSTGPATVIIRGLATGMLSTIPPVVIIALCILISYETGELVIANGGGQYALAIASVGMLSTLGVTLATDAYGPIADNAGGIAEMSGLPPEVREFTDALDALGNTTAATGKGFAIGSAVLTAIALLRAFKESALEANTSIDLLDRFVIVGVMIGCMLPYVFASLTMTAVGDAAEAVIEEVRRQFKEIHGLREGTAEADHEKCVEIATTKSLRMMVLPGLMAVLVPVAVGIIFGPKMLLGLLGGAILSGFILAVTMSNAGGAWDNAKKWVEKGNDGGKGSECHKANVVGDTVGDPFKDTSGPSLNILIKLMCVLSLVLAPIFKETGFVQEWL